MSQPWWQRAVVYQIYPRSFADLSGDGVGDLDGIAASLDYLDDGGAGSLGVDAIWLSPIYPSPMRDWGYDVSDYCAIHPEFGELGSFDRLLAEAGASPAKESCAGLAAVRSLTSPAALRERRPLCSLARSVAGEGWGEGAENPCGTGSSAPSPGAEKNSSPASPAKGDCRLIREASAKPWLRGAGISRLRFAPLEMTSAFPRCHSERSEESRVQPCPPLPMRYVFRQSQRAGEAR